MAAGCVDGKLNLSPLADMMNQSSSGDKKPAGSTASTAPAQGTSGSVDLMRVRREDERLLQSPDITPFTFDERPPGAAPSGFVAASTGKPGRWNVVTREDAPTPPHVVGQLDSSTGRRLTTLLRADPIVRTQNKMRARVMIDPAGATKTAGLVFNVRDGDPGSGYALLLDVPQNRITLERVVEGYGQPLRNDHMNAMFGALLRRLETGKWYEVSVISDTRRTGRTEFVVTIDGYKVFEGGDNVYLDPGQAGFITKDDTVAFFDTWTLNEERPELRIAAATPTPAPEESPRCVETYRFDFNNLAEGQADPQFTSVAGGNEVAGTWVAMPDDVNNPRNMKQVDRTRHAGRINLLIHEPITSVNSELTVQVRTESGSDNNRFAGLVFRYQDQQNYYIAGINTQTDEVEIIRVANGARQGVAKKSVNLRNDRWYRLKVDLEGINIRVSLDGDTMIRTQDNSFLRGKSGFFTRSDTVARFDDFKICVLPN